MFKQQSGFTLIELIAVIVILGILAATAVPKFVDLSGAAKQASLQGVAGAIESASSLNYALDLANDAGLTTELPVPVANCSDGANLLSSDLGDVAITAAVVAEGATVACTATLAGADDETFNIIGVVN